MGLFTRFSTKVNNKLAVSGFTDLFNDFHPQYTGFMTARSAHTNQVAIRKNMTAALVNKLKAQTSKVAEWDIAVQNVYKRDTPEYIGIFPNGRKPFNSGKQQDRILAVHDLGVNLTGIATLATIKTDVDAWYTDLNALQTAQQEAAGTVEVKARHMREYWENACDSLCFVSGGLQQQFNNNMAAVADYIPFDMLSRGPQKDFTGTVDPEAAKMIAKRTMPATTMITLKNTGLATIEFYMAPNKDGIIPSGSALVKVEPGITKKVAVSELGIAANKYFCVRNPSSLVDGEFEVNL